MDCRFKPFVGKATVSVVRIRIYNIRASRLIWLAE